MSSAISAMRHVRGFDVTKPFSLGMVILLMLPLVLLPLASIFIFGTSNGLASFWAALTASDAVFALKLSMVTSFYATVFNVLFGLLAAYVLSRYMFWGRTAIIVTISLPTAIPTAVAGFALLLLWGKYGMIGKFLSEDHQVMFTPYAIILANIFVTFPLAFGVLMSVFETMDRSLEEASATIGATRWQTFRHVTLPSLRGAIVTGALLTFARAIGEFGSTILVSGNLAGSTQTAPLYIFAKFNEGQVEAANAVAIVLALFSFTIFSILFFARDWLEAK
ncbi:MAG: sulfate/thiosulfate transport system permease protein [Acidobacteriota bacterium]|jgi:sulfate transport system permease protein|nr:sulfate/thiosulfate transport system permease protein [Acidobacteriota bacterium]MDT7780460.1 sulfate/thiosulfate transport system permease protein [Acidobacteriota bacterium]